MKTKVQILGPTGRALLERAIRHLRTCAYRWLINHRIASGLGQNRWRMGAIGAGGLCPVQLIGPQFHWIDRPLCNKSHTHCTGHCQHKNPHHGITLGSSAWADTPQGTPLRM
jgi:hypothetical protein